MAAAIGRTAEARNWLADVLCDGREHWCIDLRLAAERDNIAWRTLQLAAQAIGVVWKRKTFGGWHTWRLPAKRRGKGR